MNIYSTDKNKTINILLAGVGGQGVLLASDIIVDVALQSGFDTKKSEVHGMAQRGGSVVSQIRFGEKIHSPLIPEGDVHLLVAFEKLEALRYLDMLRPDGTIIYNTQQITPLTVFSTDVPYPENIHELCQRKTGHVFAVDATETAEQLGNVRIVNSFMLGALSCFVELAAESWKQVISTRVPKKTIDLNYQAFDRGREIVV